MMNYFRKKLNRDQCSIIAQSFCVHFYVTYEKTV